MLCFRILYFVKTEPCLTIQRRHIIQKKILLLSVFLLLVLLFSFLSLLIGTSSISFKDSFLALFGIGDEKTIGIITQIRLPRVLGALAVGGGLSIAGLVMQTSLDNDMASPQTLGVSSASVFGANLSILIFSSSFLLSTTIFAFLFGILCIFFILVLSLRNHFKTVTIVLSGLALSSLFQALTTILQYFADSNSLSEAIYWSFGDLSRLSLKDCIPLGVASLAGFLFFLTQTMALNGMSLGEKEARTLGIPLGKKRILFLLVSSMMVSLLLSYCGIIAFLGLIAPHIGKKFFHLDHRFLLPGTFIIGQIVLLVSDLASRLLFSGISLPVGAVLSILGVPFLLFLILRKEKDHA